MSTTTITTASPPGMFQSLASFAMRARKVMIYQPEDIIETHIEWEPAEIGLPMDERGAPKSIRKEVRPGAVGMEITIRPLTATDTERADAFTDSEIPPRVPAGPEPSPSDRNPAPRETVFDETDPAYLARVRPLQEQRNAYVVLRGVDGLWDSTPGEGEDAKIDQLQRSMPAIIIRYLSSVIYRAGFSAGDLADFFTKEGSAPTPASEPSPRKSQQGGKRK